MVRRIGTKKGQDSDYMERKKTSTPWMSAWSVMTIWKCTLTWGRGHLWLNSCCRGQLWIPGNPSSLSQGSNDYFIPSYRGGTRATWGSLFSCHGVDPLLHGRSWLWLWEGYYIALAPFYTTIHSKMSFTREERGGKKVVRRFKRIQTGDYQTLVTLVLWNLEKTRTGPGQRRK